MCQVINNNVDQISCSVVLGLRPCVTEQCLMASVLVRPCRRAVTSWKISVEPWGNVLQSPKSNCRCFISVDKIVDVEFKRCSNGHQVWDCDIRDFSSPEREEFIKQIWQRGVWSGVLQCVACSAGQLLRQRGESSREVGWVGI